MTGTINTTIIIPNWNGMRWLPDCLESIFGMYDVGFEVVVVDNGSSDESLTYLKSHHPLVRVIALEKNVGFASAMNLGLQMVETTYVAFLNNDTKVSPGWLSHLSQRLKEGGEHVVGVASLMLSMQQPDLIDDAGNHLSWYGSATKLDHQKSIKARSYPTTVFSASGGASLFRRSFLNTIGGFYAPFFAYLEDVDLGFQAQLQGYDIAFEPKATVLHHGQGSKLVRATYVKLITCNRLFLFALNVPIHLLWRNRGKLLYGQIYFFIAYGKPLASLVGYLRFMRYLPQIWNERKRRRHRMAIASDQMQSLLGHEKPSPPLKHFLKGYLTSVTNLLKLRNRDDGLPS